MQMIRSILKKVIGVFRKPAGFPYSALIEQGYMKVGQGCKLDGITIILVDTTPGTVYIEIGDDCCIQGTIMLYRATSKVIIGNNVYIGPGTFIECVEEVMIGNDVLVSMNCNIIDTNSHSLHSYERINDTVDWQKGLAHKNWNVVVSKKIIIEDKCWVGLRSIIIKGVTLGEGTVVAAGAVVTKSTESFSLVAGNPAVLIRKGD